MTSKNKNTIQKIMFPAGIFLMLFLIESVVGAGSVFTYYYFTGRKNIADIEKYTVNYSKTLAEAFTRVAEFSYRTKRYSSLKTLFHRKIEADTIDEAFFVLTDGKLIVHSSTASEKELKGNIANDEMTYNLDMILYPASKKSRKLFFSSYNIIDKKIPYSPDTRRLIRDYVYKGINTTGWIFTKGVYINNRPVGTVSFLISKERIHSSINYHLEEAKKYAAAALVMAFIISLVLSVVVMIRYRSIQRGALEYAGLRKGFSPVLHPDPENIEIDLFSEEEVIDISGENRLDPDLDEIVDEPLDEPIVLEEEDDEHPGYEDLTALPEQERADDEYITIELMDEEESETEPFSASEELFRETGHIRKYIAPVISSEAVKSSVIKDAIPVERKR